MQELPGTAFLLTHEARYKWKHGLAPVSAVRVSVTCRFFKTEVFGKYMTSIGAPKKLKSWQQRRLKRKQQEQEGEDTTPADEQQMAEITAATTQVKIEEPTKASSEQKASPVKQDKAETEGKVEKKPEDVHVELCLNKDSHQTKPAVVSSRADIKQLIAAAKNKLRVKAKKVL